MSFLCRRCGKCCEDTDMPLTRDDVERILALGYRLEEFAEFRRGVLRLKNVGGRCVFNDPETKLCKIYEHRPDGCRLYPLVYVDGVGPALDAEVCPAAYSASREFVESGKRKLLSLLKQVVREGLDRAPQSAGCRAYGFGGGRYATSRGNCLVQQDRKGSSRRYS